MDARMPPVTIERIGRDASVKDITELAHLLIDAIESGSGVSFLAGLTENEAAAWWRSVLQSSSPRAIILVARADDGIVGTVQLQPAWAPNQPHRGDIAKLIVHRRARKRGLGRQLMAAIEQAGRDAGFTLLLLDTCKGYDAERLYESTGWVRVGEVPRFALNPDRSWCDTVFFYKTLTD
jgi:GNAT superfamily N-acetyltransferase